MIFSIYCSTQIAILDGSKITEKLCRLAALHASYGQTTDKIVRTIITEFDARLTQKSLAYFRSTWTWYLSILGVTWTVTFLSTFSSFRPMAHDTILRPSYW